MKPGLFRQAILALTFSVLLVLLLQDDRGANAAITVQERAIPPPPSQPVVAKIYYPDPVVRDALINRLDVWEVHPDADYLVAALTPAEYSSLLAQGFRIQIDPVLSAMLNQPLVRQPGQVEGIPGFPCYRTVEETYSSLSGLAAAHPNLAVWHDFGDSWEKNRSGGLPGYDLYALELTNGSIPGPKPTFFVMAAIHARELATAELATRFAEYLLNQYNLDADITWLLDNFKIVIVPMTNPDGRKKAETGLYWRKNTDPWACNDSDNWGIDLNRNHTFKWGGDSNNPCSETYQGPAAGSEPETRALQAYLATLYPDQRGPGDNDPAPLTASGSFITLHSYGNLVLWPWGWGNSLAPNAAQFQTFGRKMAYFNGYLAEQSIDLYPTTGTSDDWAYGELGVAAYTFEVGTTFFQDCHRFNNTIYPANRQALLYAFKAARRPYQNPAGPDSLNLAVSPPSVPAGGLINLTATADDSHYVAGAGEPVQPISGAHFTLDMPAWQAGANPADMVATDGVFNTSTENISGSVCTAGLSPGRHTMFVESKDAAPSQNWGVTSAVFMDVSASPAPFTLTPDVSSKFGNPGTVQTYSLRIHNFTPTPDSYTIQLQGNQWVTDITPIGGELAPCQEALFHVMVQVPQEALPEASDAVTVTATSQSNPLNLVSLRLTTYASEQRGLVLEPGISIQGGTPGTTLTYTLQLTNTGNISDSFAIQWEGSSWPISAPGTLGPFGSGKGGTLPVRVTIPITATATMSDTVMISARPAGTHLQPKSAQLLTIAQPIPALSATPREYWGLPSQVVTYTLSLQNVGAAEDTYDIHLEPGAWQASGPPAQVILAGGARSSFPLVISIPASAAFGDRDTVLVQFVSHSNPDFTINLPLTTHVWNRTYFPLIY